MSTHVFYSEDNQTMLRNIIMEEYGLSHPAASSHSMYGIYMEGVRVILENYEGTKFQILSNNTSLVELNKNYLQQVTGAINKKYPHVKVNLNNWNEKNKHLYAVPEVTPAPAPAAAPAEKTVRFTDEIKYTPLLGLSNDVTPINDLPVLPPPLPLMQTLSPDILKLIVDNQKQILFIQRDMMMHLTEIAKKLDNHLAGVASTAVNNNGHT